MSTTPNPTALAINDPMIKDLEKSTSSSSFIPSIRLVQGMSEILNDRTKEAHKGDFYSLNNVYGPEVKVVIGPWRFHALRLRDGSVDLESFNLSPNSKFDEQTNTWVHPDGYTKNFLDIKNKVVPNDKMKLRNLFGVDILFWVPDFNEYGVFFVAGTALTIPKPPVHTTCMQNPGRTAYLTGKLYESSQFNWHIPMIRLGTEQSDHSWDPEVIKNFLAPGLIDSESNPEARPR